MASFHRIVGMSSIAASRPAEAASTAEAVGLRAWYTLGILVVIYVMGSVDRAVPSVIVEPLKGEFASPTRRSGCSTVSPIRCPMHLQCCRAVGCSTG